VDDCGCITINEAAVKLQGSLYEETHGYICMSESDLRSQSFLGGVLSANAYECAAMTLLRPLL